MISLERIKQINFEIYNQIPPKKEDQLDNTLKQVLYYIPTEFQENFLSFKYEQLEKIEISTLDTKYEEMNSEIEKLEKVLVSLYKNAPEKIMLLEDAKFCVYLHFFFAFHYFFAKKLPDYKDRHAHYMHYALMYHFLKQEEQCAPLFYHFSIDENFYPEEWRIARNRLCAWFQISPEDFWIKLEPTLKMYEIQKDDIDTLQSFIHADYKIIPPIRIPPKQGDVKA